MYVDLFAFFDPFSTQQSISNHTTQMPFSPNKEHVYVGLDVTVQWSSPSDDAAITSATESLLRQAIAAAKSQDDYNEYLYLNYALQAQDPISSYGQQNLDDLRQVSQKYDRDGVFQKLVPGGFKLWRQNVTCC